MSNVATKIVNDNTTSSEADGKRPPVLASKQVKRARKSRFVDLVVAEVMGERRALANPPKDEPSSEHSRADNSLVVRSFDEQAEDGGATTLGEIIRLTATDTTEDFAEASLFDLSDDLEIMVEALNGGVWIDLHGVADALSRLRRRAQAAALLAGRLRASAAHGAQLFASACDSRGAAE